MKKIKKLQQIIILTGLSFSFLFLFSFKNIAKANTIVYPTKTYCFYTFRDFSGTDFETARTATTANLIQGHNGNDCSQQQAGGSNSYMARTILEFDRSQLPSDFITDNVSLNFSWRGTDGTTTGTLEEFNPISGNWTATSTPDKNNWNKNQFSNFQGYLPALTTSQTSSITLDNTIKTDIFNQTSTYGFAIRSFDDYTDNPPQNSQIYYEFAFAEGSTTDLGYPNIYLNIITETTPTSSQTLTIEYPENNSSTYPFDYWKLKATGLTTGQTYRSEIFWQVQPNLTALQNDIGTFTASASTTEFLIPKSRIGFYLPQTTSTPVTITAYLENTPYYGGNLAKATSTFNLKIDPTSNTTSTFIYINLTTSTQNPNLIQPVIVNNPTIPGGTTYNHTTSTSQCIAPAGITDIGGGISYGLCETGQFLFTPSQGFTDKLQNTFSEFQTKFPFAIVFGLLNTAKANATTTEGNYDLIINIPTTNLHIPILTSTTLSKAIGSSSQQIIFTTEKNLAWITCAIGILLLII